MAISPKLPSINQILTMAIAIVIIFFVAGFMPETIKRFFRVS